MEAINFNTDIIINDDSKNKVAVHFINSYDVVDMIKKEQIANGFLSKELSLFQFIKEIEKKATDPITVKKVFVES